MLPSDALNNFEDFPLIDRTKVIKSFQKHLKQVRREMSPLPILGNQDFDIPFDDSDKWLRGSE